MSRSPLSGVYRRPYQRDPLVYVALVLGVLLLVRAVARESSPVWQAFTGVMAIPMGFVIVGFVGGFFRDPPPPDGF